MLFIENVFLNTILDLSFILDGKFAIIVVMTADSTLKGM
jgi:hypothetical protein